MIFVEFSKSVGYNNTQNHNFETMPRVTTGAEKIGKNDFHQNVRPITTQAFKILENRNCAADNNPNKICKRTVPWIPT